MAFPPPPFARAARRRAAAALLAAGLALPAAAPAQVAPAQVAPARVAPAGGAGTANYADLFAPGAPGGIVRAGYERPAGARDGGVVRTAARMPGEPARPTAAAVLGSPAADLDFFLAPNRVPEPAPRSTPHSVPVAPKSAPAEPVAAKPVAAKPVAAAEPAPAPEEAGPRPGGVKNPAPAGFSAARFGFAADPAPVAERSAVERPAAKSAAAGPAAAKSAAAKRDGEVKTADLPDAAADPFAVVPAAAPAPVPVPGPEPAPADDPFAPDPLAGTPPTTAPAPAPIAADAKRVASATDRGAGVRAGLTLDRVPDAATAEVSANGEDELYYPDANAGRPADAVAQNPSLGVGPQTLGVTTRWEHAGPVRVGRECVSTLVVTNTGPQPTLYTQVIGSVSEDMGLTGTAPAPAAGAGTYNPRWAFGAIPAGEERRVVFRYTPVAEGSRRTLAAMVDSRQIALAGVDVTDPKLTVALEGAREALLGESATQTVLVSNPGTGAVDEVLIEAVLPEGLEHRGGPKKLTMNVSGLAPGETKPVRLALVASAGGPQTLKITARGDGGLSATTWTTVEVASPQIDLAIAGPSLRYVNREATVTLTVTNPGDAATDNVRLGYRVPAGFAFLSADKSGAHDPAGRTVRWFLGRIEPGESLTTAVKLKATAGGEQVHRAEVGASSGAKAAAEHVTRVEGTASLVLTITDSDDPVEVGAETIYTVTVKNEGTAPAKTVGLACRLPEGTDLGPVRGPAASRREGRLVLFDSLPELKPGKAAEYTIRVKGTTPGGKRFQTRLVSESISEPLIHEEITKFYAE